MSEVAEMALWKGRWNGPLMQFSGVRHSQKRVAAKNHFVELATECSIWKFSKLIDCCTEICISFRMYLFIRWFAFNNSLMEHAVKFFLATAAVLQRKTTHWIKEVILMKIYNTWTFLHKNDQSHSITFLRCHQFVEVNCRKGRWKLTPHH